jgi:hypothetical protein
LAEAHGERAISIVLSGSGSDEAVGIGRIKECGGITLVQSPEDAEYGEMPANAMATGQVDIVLPIADIPQKLIELSANARSITRPSAGDESTTAADGAEAEALGRARAAAHPEGAARAPATISGTISARPSCGALSGVCRSTACQTFRRISASSERIPTKPARCFATC